MNIAGFCDNDTAMALRLAGIREIHVPEKGEELKTWNVLSERDDIGVIFVTEQIVESLGKHLKDYRTRNILPIIVEIPDKTGRIKDHEDYVSHLIKKAVGVDISKEKQ